MASAGDGDGAGRGDEPDRVGPPEGWDRLERWVAELRTDDAARGRARTSWLARQAEEEATLAGVLTDLAERGRPVVVSVRGGGRHRGVLRLVGVDFCALQTPTGADVVVAFAAVTAVAAQPGETAVTGDRGDLAATTLGHALAALAGAGRRVRVLALGGGDALSGELRSVGRDVVALRLDGTGGTVYVPLASLAEVSLTESG